LFNLVSRFQYRSIHHREVGGGIISAITLGISHPLSFLIYPICPRWILSLAATDSFSRCDGFFLSLRRILSLVAMDSFSRCDRFSLSLRWILSTLLFMIPASPLLFFWFFCHLFFPFHLYLYTSEKGEKKVSVPGIHVPVSLVCTFSFFIEGGSVRVAGHSMHDRYCARYILEYCRSDGRP